LVETLRVQHEVVVGLEEFDRQRDGVRHLPKILGRNLINSEKADPFFSLGVVGGNFGVQFLRDAVERNAIVHLDDEFLLEPEPLLEVLQLGEEVDQLAGDLPQDFDLCEVLLGLRHIGGLDVVQSHHLVLDVEVQFASQKAAQVLVDEVVHRVAGGVLTDVLCQQRSIRPFLRRRWGFQDGQVLFGSRIIQTAEGFEDSRDRFLTAPGLPGLILAGLVGIGPVLEAHDEIAVLDRDRIVLVQDEVAFGPIAGLDVAMLALGGRDDEEMHVERLIGGREKPFGLPDLRGLGGVEGEVREVLSSLDVILVLVGPVQTDFRAIVGHGVGSGLARCLPAQIPQRHEIAGVVIPLEEAIQVVVNLCLGTRGVFGRSERGFGLLHGLGLFRVGRPERFGLGYGVVVCLLEVSDAGGIALAELLLDRLEQVVLQEGRHLPGLGVHDPVEAKIQIRLVKLEQLLEQPDEFVSLLLYGRHVVFPMSRSIGS